MLEVFVERWVNANRIEFPWSVWIDGSQVYSSHGGPGYSDAESSERDALRFVNEQVKRRPDRVRRL